MRYFLEKTGSSDKSDEWDLKSPVAGAAAGALSTYALYPLTTYTTKMQSGSAKDVANFKKELKGLSTYGKVRRLYQGANLSALKIGLGTAITFPTYHYLYNKLKDNK